MGAPGRTAQQRDEFMQGVIAAAGSAVKRSPDKTSFLESLVEEALSDEIRTRGGRAELTGRKRLQLADWGEGQLRGFDLEVTLGDQRRPSLLIEAKVDDVDQTLWDLFKLTSALREGRALAGYLVVAAPADCWAGERDCVDLFAESPTHRTWDSRRMLTGWKRAWADLLKGGTARPTRLPEQLKTLFVGRSDIAALPGYQFRCVSVRPDPDAGTFHLVGGYPTTR
jgi:hypothetical protein